MISDVPARLRDAAVVLASLAVLGVFVRVELPGLFVFPAQITAAVATSAFALRLMRVV